jgi:hypothetical protein
MRSSHRGITARAQLLVLAVVIVILAGGLAYVYLSTKSQITSLGSENQTLCSQLSSLNRVTQRFYDNLTAILRGTILNDNSLMQALNSSKPSGYIAMINLLKAQVEVSSLLLTATSKPVAIGSNSCTG